MSVEIIEDLRAFLKNARLSTYEINSFIVLLCSNDLTAKEICFKTGIPTGRIYEVLEELRGKGMVEIQDSRPKRYRALLFNAACNNLITHKINNSKRETNFLINQAKNLEFRIEKSNAFRFDTSKIFFSTAFGYESIFSLYQKHSNEIKEALLMTGFIDDNTINIVRHAGVLYNMIYDLIERGIRVKYLWSFDYDNRPLSDEQKIKCQNMFNGLKKKLRELFNLPFDTKLFQMKCIYKKFPTYYDIYDKKRVILKLQDPLNPPRIYACINILDVSLAEELRKKYYDTWDYEANDL